MRGKRAIVTGSTSGIGLGVARALAASGADILLNGFGDKADIEKLRAGIAREYGVRVSSKHGLLGLTKVVALETATGGITCNAICPGWVLTPLVQKQIDERAAKEGIPAEKARRELLAEKQPSLEFATPEQIGGTVVFLCSEAAAQIRGVGLPLDGGWTAQ